MSANLTAAGARRPRIVVFAAIGVAILLGLWAAVADVPRVASHAAPRAAPRAEPAVKSMKGMEGMNMTSSGTVVVSPEQIRQFGITFDTARERPLVAVTRATGVVTFDETRVTQVAPRISGFVERLRVNATGQRVSRGQALLDIYSPELVSAQQELLSAGQLQREIGRSAVPGVPGNASDLVAAARRRLQLWDIPTEQVDDIVRTGRVRRTLTLVAPASGIVVEKKVLQGQSISAGEPLYTLADLSDVWVDVQLREVDAAAVHTGTGADIDITALPGLTFKGRVTYVYPTIDSASRAIRARVVVSNGDGLLKPGMHATVRLTAIGRTALSVPSSAVLRTGERNVVFMDMGKGNLMPVEVKVGRSAGEYTEILSGLAPGQRVVTSAQFLLDSESNLGEVMRAMIGQTSTR